jgi:hypothetical protein
MARTFTGYPGLLLSYSAIYRFHTTRQKLHTVSAPVTFRRRFVIREVLNWIDRESAQLEKIIEGAHPEAMDPAPAPEALKAALGQCQQEK